MLNDVTEENEHRIVGADAQNDEQPKFIGFLHIQSCESNEEGVVVAGEGYEDDEEIEAPFYLDTTED